MKAPSYTQVLRELVSAYRQYQDAIYLEHRSRLPKYALQLEEVSTRHDLFVAGRESRSKGCIRHQRTEHQIERGHSMAQRIARRITDNRATKGA
jgi:hypothetical protein